MRTAGSSCSRLKQINEYGETKSKYQSMEVLSMAVRIEKKARVWTVIHSRPEARNAMDPESADALVAAFTEFERDRDAAVAVLWGEGGAFCAGWDLKYCATMVQDAKALPQIDYPLDDRQPIPRGPLGPTRLELQAGDRRGRRPGGGRRLRARALV